MNLIMRKIGHLKFSITLCTEFFFFSFVLFSLLESHWLEIGTTLNFKIKYLNGLSFPGNGDLCWRHTIVVNMIAVRETIRWNLFGYDHRPT